MSIGARLREERTRLGYSQPDFAKLAGASKNSQINWEKDASSPTAVALVAFAEAGADVLYILTGRRSADRPGSAVTQIEDQLAEIERDLLEPARHGLPGEDEDRAEERVRSVTTRALRSMLAFDKPFLTPELAERASSLLDIASDPVKLSLYRAADYAQMKKRREQMKERLATWLDDSPYEPAEVVRNLLASLAIEYAVPVKTLVELVEHIHSDILDRLSSNGQAKPFGWRP